MELKVGIVGAHAHLLVPALRKYNYELIDSDTSPEDFRRFGLTHLVSFGYRKLIPDVVLAHFGGRVFNIHISLLPWNRGSDPNFWSWFDGTPKGVSLHQISQELDSGPLIGQTEVDFGANETLATSYQGLLETGVDLFAQYLESLLWMEPNFKVISGVGSYHSSKDFRSVEYVLESGWDTPCSVVEDWGRRLGRRDNS